MGIESRQWYRGEERRPGFLGSVAPVTKALVIANIICYLLQAISINWFRWNPVTGGLGMIPEDVIGRFFIWQIFTSMFLHDPGSILHIFLNMLILYMFGPHVERRLGGRTYLKFYFLAGLVAGLAYVIFGVLRMRYNPAIGASGAIMGVIVYFTMLNPDLIIRFMFVIPMRMKWATAIFVGIDLYYFAFAPGSTGVANSAHLGGALFGYLYFKFGHRVDRFFTNLEVKARVKRQQRERHDAARLRQEVDRLLEKVYEVGIDGLTEKERRRLNEASRKLREMDR